MVFFENEHCVKCGEKLGFFPDTLQMETAPAIIPENSPYHYCANKINYDTCNWMVTGGDGHSFCLACRLNDVIPDLSIAGNRERWYKLELAKRRCLYTFLQLGLPIEAGENPGTQPIQFRFLSEGPNLPPVLTGHDNGVITINIAEADEDERERRRLKLHEPYRTLIGHIRHESGHYYWDRIIANSSHLQPFRALFGDETLDYNEALQRYYKQGPAADWSDRTVTAYASLHPWEDWAETWAHYLHIMDAVETAGSFGVALKDSKKTSNPPATTNPFNASASGADFDELIARWLPLTCALNSINRGMGLPDLYPFILTKPVIEKLRFIHGVIKNVAKQSSSGQVSATN